MSGIDPDDMAVGSRRGIITAIGESLTTGFTENRGFGRFLTVFGFRCPFMFTSVVFDSFFCLCPLLQVFVGCLFLFDLGCIKFDILFHGFLLFLDRFDHGGHFLVNGIDLPVGFIAESKKQSNTDKTRQKQDDRHQMRLFFHKNTSFLGGCLHL